jgi:predicted phage terminase large subunit-like protein
MPPTKLQPQPGPQTLFHKSPADIALYGGAAGGGKTWSILAEPLRHLAVSGFNGSIFRKTTPQIQKPGGLWDASQEIYPFFGGFGTTKPYRYRFPDKVKITLENLNNEKALANFDGSEIAYIGFDQLEQFSEKEFWRLYSRNRSTCGISPYMRGNMNPDPDSWIKKLIEWYLLPEGDFADPKKAGVIRWFIRLDGEIIWGKSWDDLILKYKDKAKYAKTFTFIPAQVTDNQILLSKNPEYLATLESLQLVQRERLLKGNWKIREVAGNLFRREWVEIVDAAPADLFTLRYWDFAGTKNSGSNNPDYTVGVKMGMDNLGRIFILNVVRFQGNPYQVEQTLLNTASADGKGTHVMLEFDPGQAGKFQIQYFVGKLAGYNVGFNHPTKSKIERFSPFSAQAEAGNVKVLRAKWTEDYLTELENFPPEKNKGKDDQVDSTSGAFQSMINIFKKIG